MVNRSATKTAGEPAAGGWLEQRQSALRITTTTATPDGQTLDWIPVESQTSAAIGAPPPAVPPSAASLAVSASAPERPTASVSFDIGDAGPAGHVPVPRPDPARIDSLDRLARVQSKSGGLRVNVNCTNKKPADPNPAGYFHALSSEWITSYGADAWLNLWDPVVDIPLDPETTTRSRSCGCRTTRSPSCSPWKAG
jgi:hypothetical protein